MYLKALGTLLWGILILYLQVLILPMLSLWGVQPLLLLPYIIFIVWNREQVVYLPVAFLIGLLYDTLNPDTFGMYALIFCLIAILIEILRIPFEKDSLVAKFIAIGGSNLLYGIFSFLVLGISHGFNATLYRLAPLSLLYNALFSSGVFFLMQLISRLSLSIRND